MNKKMIIDAIKLFWNMHVCVFKKHNISDKDWNSLTPLLPTIDAQCTRCGYPFTLYLDKDGEKRGKSKYNDGGF